MNNLNILLVEDAESICSLDHKKRIETLTRMGLQVATASSLAEAREKVQEHEYDGILLDLELPDSKGMSTLIEMRESARGIPIVVYTQLP